MLFTTIIKMFRLRQSRVNPVTVTIRSEFMKVMTVVEQ